MKKLFTNWFTTAGFAVLATAAVLVCPANAQAATLTSTTT
jgi:hypothetical protein